jgi:pimeloyl-ACP methyl ester carboxylesterase
VIDRLAEARGLLDAIAARERADPDIDPNRTTRWWLRADVAPTAVVLLHGLTNSPPQYDLLAPQLHARGHVVIVPRMPYHGYHDRMTDAIARLRADQLQEAALEAVVIAAMCGRRVVVLGISSGATLAGWLAARTHVDSAIAVAPFCGLRELRGELNDALGMLLRVAPNVFGWWDPRRKEDQPPPHGYPRYATRALGESLLISSCISAEPRTAGDHGRRAILVVNEHDPVVNNAHAARRFAELEDCGVACERVVLHGLPHIHDIVEPAIPQARTDLVYPKLIELVES